MNILAIHDPETRLDRLRLPDPDQGSITHETRFVPGPWDAVVRWGRPIPFDEDGMPTINAADALHRFEDADYVVEIFRSHGIPTQYFEPARKKKARIRARYRLHVCDLRVLSVLRRRRKGYRVVSGGGSKRMREVRAMAVRCVYVLGLHLASVDIGVLGKKYAVPLSINPAPPLTKRTGRLYAGAARTFARRRYERLSGPLKPVLIGADLELIMRKGRGRLLYASSYFSRRGRLGYDQQGSRRHRGAHPIVEVRPAPSEDPTELVAHIKAILRRAVRRTPKRGVSWQAGSLPVGGYPIGGHIHFSRVDLTTELLRAFDNYLALPMMMLENPEKARRRRPKYGYLGEFRWQYHGGFEYRVPSSWIVAPHFALAFACLAKLVVDNYEVLSRNIFTDPAACRAFYQSDKESMNDLFEKNWSDIEALDDFTEYERHLQIIPNLVREGKRWNETRDLRVRWGLVTRRKKRRRKRRSRS